jgi:WD40 repeat protein
LTPDRQLLAVAAADGTRRLWTLSRPGHPALVGMVAEVGHTHPLYAAAFSPDGRVLAAAGQDGKVRLWDVTDPRHPTRLGQPLTGPKNTIYSLAFSPHGDLLAAGSADTTVWLWNVTDPAHPVPVGGPLTGAKGYVQAVAFSPDGHLLAAGSADHTVRLWNVADPAKPRLAGRLTGPAHAVDSVAFSPDGDELAAGSYDDLAWLWGIAKPAKPVLVRKFTGATDWIMAIAFSPDGTVLAAGGSDGQMRLWNAATGAPIAVIPHPQPVTALVWDGPHLLVTGDADGYVRAWHLPVPDLMTGGPVYSIALSPAGRTLAVGGIGLEVWNPAARTLTASAPIPDPALSDTVNAVALSPGREPDRHRIWRRAHPVVAGARHPPDPARDAAGRLAVARRVHQPGRVRGVQPGRQAPGQRR